MTATSASPNYRGLLLVSVATLILTITMGVRQTTGLFVLPIVTTTGVGIASISFALAIGQFVWGAAQPVFSIMADKYGAPIVIALGGITMAVGYALTPLAHSEIGLMVTMGLLMAAGAGAGSFSVLIGATATRLGPEKRSFASGVINAGGSFGQFLFAPLAQFIISAWSWATGMYVLAVATLLTIPLAWLLRAPRGASLQSADAAKPAAAAKGGVKAQIQRAMHDRNYLLLHVGFFTCGFHIAFLVTHFPSDLQLCGLAPSVAAYSIALIGLFNVVGSLGAGWLGQRYQMKNILFFIYASRAVLIVIYLLMPKTAFNVYLFAASLGLTWLATVPPTAGIIGKLFDVRYLGTLFGLTLFSHQVGGFMGAWLGGIAMAQLGSYDWVWYADIILALLAAFSNLPIREPRLGAQPAMA